MEKDNIEYGIPSKIDSEKNYMRNAREFDDYYLETNRTKTPIKTDFGISSETVKNIPTSDPIMHPTLHNEEDFDYGIPSKIDPEKNYMRNAREFDDYYLETNGTKTPIKTDVGIPSETVKNIPTSNPIMHPTLHNEEDFDYGIPSQPFYTEKRETIDPIFEKRKKIEIELSKTIECTFGKIVYSPSEIIKRLEETIAILEESFSYSPEITELLLSGELNKDAIYMGNDSKESSFPLYFLLDLIIKSISQHHINKFSNKEDILTKLAKLQLLRDKSTNLKYDNSFNPNEPLNENTLNDILNSKGNFRKTIESEEGIEYLGIIIDGVNQNVVYKNGDYYTEGNARYWSSKPNILYQKTKKQIDEKVLEKVKIKLERLNTIVGKYFSDGKVPTSREFYSKIIDKELDSSIFSLLFSISLIKDKSPFYDGTVAILAASKVDELENLEKTLLEQKEKEEFEKRTAAIEEAKIRYNKQNLLWKLVNKKSNPLNVNFDSMKTEEIEGLYMR